MTKIYVMETCRGCTYVEEQIKGSQDFEIIDIGSHVLKLREFLMLRDSNPAFEAVRRAGRVGIPCFVFEDGRVSLSPEDAGLVSRPSGGAACRLDGTGC